MISLVDLDSHIYSIGFASEEDDEKLAVARMAEALEELLFVELKDYDDYQLYITGKDNFRLQVDPNYKAHRKAEKPKHFKLLRDYVVSAWGAIVVDGEEADDRVAIEAIKNFPDCIIVSIDKDLNNVVGKHYNWRKKLFYTVTPEEALHNFYMQLLTGDTSDGIKGVKGIGPKKAQAIYSLCSTEQEYYKAALEAYKGDSVELLKNAQLLWIRHCEGELWQPPKDVAN